MVTVAVIVLNLSTYAFTVIAAHLLGPAEFGATSALMGLLLVLNVVGLGLQTTGARRLSHDPERADAHAREVLALTWRAAPLLGLLCLVLSPLMVHGFRLHHAAAAVLVAVTVVPQTALGGQAGVLQGRRRWSQVAMLYAGNGVGRLVLGIAGIVIMPNSVGALAGTALGSSVPVVIGAVLLRGSGGVRGVRVRGVITEMAHNSHALLAFLALSNADIVVARVVLPEHRSGLYAGGLILVKAVLFLPQFVIVLAFPSLASGGTERARSRRLSLGLVVVLGLVAIGGALVLPQIAMIFVGGHQYHAIESRLWEFALLGTALSMVQLLVYDVVARQDRVAVAFLWLAVVGIAVSGAVVHSVGGLLHWVIAVDVVAAGAQALLSAPQRASWGPFRRRRPAAP